MSRRFAISVALCGVAGFAAAPAAAVGSDSGYILSGAPMVISGARGQDPSRPFVESAAAVAQHAQALTAARVRNAAMTGRSYYIGIEGSVQEQSEWCVPASTQVILTHWKIYLSQQSLATAEHTSNTSGTYLSNVPTALNLREHHWAYTYYETSVSAQSVITYASIDLSNGAPELIGVQGGVLDYWIYHHAEGVHALTVYATNGSSTITEWDPLNASWGGIHTVSTSQTAAAINAGNAGFVW